MKKILLTMMFLASVSPAAYAVEAPMPPEDDAPPIGMERGMGRGMGEGGRHDRMERRHMHMMERMDTNDDGSVTKAEFTAFHEKHFETMDQNKDGTITKEEMKNFRPPAPLKGKADGTKK